MGSLRLELSPEDLRKRFLECTTPADLAALLDVEYSRLVYHVYKVPPKQRYSTFSIPKKTGGVRTIHAPATALKIIQRKLNQILSACYRAPPPVHGFTLKRNILTNAAPHSSRRIVVNIDLTDYFPTITFPRVYGLFKAKPYSFPTKLAACLANIVCFNGGLPQGAPTSPVMSNLICRRMDRALARLASRHRFVYTRYADDLTFSTWRRKVPTALAIPKGSGWACGTDLTAILASNGFVPNLKKVRVMGQSQRQEVTGLIVNARPNVGKRLRKQVRAMLHSWKEYGPEAAEDLHFAKWDTKHRSPFRPRPRFRRIVEGKLEFMRSIVSDNDPGLLVLRREFAKLASLPLPPTPSEQLLAKRHEDIWIVENETTQGTAFRLDGVGFVSCLHAVTGDSCAFRGDKLSEKFKITIVAKSESLDLVVFDLVSGPPNLSPGLVASATTVEVKDVIEVWGFPSHYKHDSVSVWTGVVAGFRPWQMPGFIQVNAPIIAGNSGGPVLNRQGLVVGVAARGIKSIDDPDSTPANGVIPISAVGQLKPAHGS